MSFTVLAKILTTLVTVYPALVAFIKEIEVAGSLAGPEKKAAVLQFLNSLLEGLSSFVPAIGPIHDEIVKVAGVLIDATVTVFNFVGIFKKATPVAPTA
jgi:hypothetical protein